LKIRRLRVFRRGIDEIGPVGGDRLTQVDYTVVRVVHNGRRRSVGKKTVFLLMSRYSMGSLGSLMAFAEYHRRIPPRGKGGLAEPGFLGGGDQAKTGMLVFNRLGKKKKKTVHQWGRVMQLP